MFAFHFPPIQGSSGVHRTVSFCKRLIERNWRPVVITVPAFAFQESRRENIQFIPKGTRVIRALALDASKHLAIQGRYLGWSSIPDRWVTWVPFAVASAIWAAIFRKFAVIYSTYPIASAHVAGYVVRKITRLPWIADFRDPMAQDGYPVDRATWKAYKWIEERVVMHADYIIFSTPGAQRDYIDTYGEVVRRKSVVIENGYDEGMFKRAESRLDRRSECAVGPIKFVHAGVLYPNERDPSAFFDALGRMRARGAFKDGSIEIALRGTGHDDIFRPLLEHYEIGDIVHLLPPVGYVEALEEMLEADGLLLFQSKGCNHQIPAKLYEYLRAGRPIYALTDPEGDTARTLREAGWGNIARMDSVDEIAAMMAQAIEDCARARENAKSEDGEQKHTLDPAPYSREARADSFVSLVETAASIRSTKQ